jgi:competence protein ComGF
MIKYVRQFKVDPSIKDLNAKKESEYYRGYKKGLIRILKKIEFAYMLNDVERGLITCRITFHQYKVPRIFKHIKRKQ